MHKLWYTTNMMWAEGRWKIIDNHTGTGPDGIHSEFIYVEGYGFEDPCIGPSRNKIRVYANAIGYALLLFLLLQSVWLVPRMMAAAVRLALPTVRIYNGSILAPREIVELVNILCSVVYFVLPMFLLCTVLRMPMRTAFPAGRVPVRITLPCMGLVLASSAIGSTVSMLLAGLLGKVGLRPTGPALSRADSPGMLVLMVISVALVPAVLEEMLFRGVLLQSLRRFGERFALVTTSLLFALAHRNLVQIPNALITGLVLGFLMLRVGSLRVVMLCHFFNNLIPVLLQVLPVGTGGAWMLLLLNLIYIFVGLAALVFLCVRHGPFFYPPRGEGRAAEREKYMSFFSSIPMLTLLLLFCLMIGINMVV